MEKSHRQQEAHSIMTRWLRLTKAIVCVSLLLVVPAQAASAQQTRPMRLWRQIDIGTCKGSFICPGDLNNDRQLDFLLYRQGPMTAPGYLVAIDGEGKTLWELGDRTIQTHRPDGAWNEPALRGIAFVYDIDGDKKSEVVTEFWKNDELTLCVLDGCTGDVLHRRRSPFGGQVRGGRRSRCHPVGRIAFSHGVHDQPTIILKYGASNHVPCLAVALDAKLNVLWQLEGSPHSMGHIPTVDDVDGDGRDEIILGTLLADLEGHTCWEKQVDRHADCTAIADVHPSTGKEVLISVCSTGPVYCLSANGAVLWEKTRQEVPHGQGVWVGDFIEEEPGQEAIILRSGHVGDFLTVRGTDGTSLATFRHTRNFKGYPDFPCIVNWRRDGGQCLWIPIDRTVVDGYGKVVAELGPSEALVKRLLNWGETKSNIAVQAFALDVCGDAREELVLYQPYNGSAILIFTQWDSDGQEKPYVHEKDAYNIRSYF